jgi:hypothetical protein
MWRNIPSFKTTGLEKMRNYFKYVYPHMNVILQFHLYKNFRGLSLRSYCRGRATLHKICVRIVGNKKP